MIGAPKKVNSKSDYYYILEHFGPAVWRPYWERLKADKMRWLLTGKLTSADDGLTDETHKVETYTTKTGSEIKTEYYQYEYMIDPSSDFVRLNFTDDEIALVLGSE